MCLEEVDTRNLAEVTWLSDMDKNYYCSSCLPTVINDMKTTPWVKKDGYLIDYPYRR